MEYYSAIKKNEIMSFATTWMDLEVIILSEISHRPHPEEPRFRLLAREEGSFPGVVGKEIPCSRRISREGALHIKGERNSRVMPPFPEYPRCLSPFQGNLFSLHYLDFQAEDRLTLR